MDVQGPDKPKFYLEQAQANLTTLVDESNKQNAKDIPWYVAEFAKNPEASESLTDTTRTVITPDGWKLTLSLRGDHELYNLIDDPSETTNLIKQKRASDKIIKTLKEKIFAWQKRTNDKVIFLN